MSEKNIKSRIIHKHDIESNWQLATNFTPMKGEIIVYDVDANYNYERLKIGDGETNVNLLPFADGALRASIEADISAVETRIDDIDALVGDTSVSEQIADANIIYVGPDMPTDPKIKVWINTAEEAIGVVPVLPRVATITLNSANWTGSSSPYSQVVNIASATSASKIDLQPTVAQIVSLQNDDIALMAENVNGVVTIYSFGGKPSADMTMQVLLTEVSYV